MANQCPPVFYLVKAMNNELYHYNHNHDPRSGRFTFSYGGVSKARVKKNYSDREINAAKRQRRIESREYRNVSDEELKRRVDRLAMEKRYRELSNEDLHPGKMYVQEVMKTTGKQATSKITNNMIDRGKNLIDRELGLSSSNGGDGKRNKKN